MSDPVSHDPVAPSPPAHPARRFGRGRIALVAAGLVALGGAGGAVAVEMNRPAVTMAPATPVAIRTLAAAGDDAIVTVRGRVAEIFGNKFVLADASGRALIDTGRQGEDGTLVAPGQPVTVQGRFDHGFVHAAFLVGADGKVRALGPLGHGPGDRRGPHGGRHGPDDRADRGPDGGPDRGPDGRADSPPPPPPPATVGAPAPAAAPAGA